MNRMSNKIESVEHLLDQLNQAKVLLCGEDCHSFTMKQLKYHAFDTKHSHYKEFKILKKNKKDYRTISAPVNGLKLIQVCLNYILKQYYKPNPCAMGFVEGRSVVSNAKVHVGQNYVYNIDLENFFPSITGGRLYKRLQVKPFCFPPKVAAMITQLCCCKNEAGVDVLPQGAPTSPLLTNIICERLDIKLQKLAIAYDLKYTRYADDITFSGVNDKFDSEGRFCSALRNIVENEEHFKINESKVRVRNREQRQEVTGLTVNEKVGVSKSYVKQIRAMLHNWEMLGYDVAQEKFEKSLSKLRKTKVVPSLQNVLEGKLAYLCMVKGSNNPVYVKYKGRLAALVKNPSQGTEESMSSSIDEVFSDNFKVSDVLDIWESSGIEDAFRKVVDMMTQIRSDKKQT